MGAKSDGCNAKDHPRSRGEHTCIATLTSGKTGSSPLARGAHRGNGEHVEMDRIIPARAGSTCSWIAICFRASDHPRSRGEHKCRWQPVDQPLGSSPLARGALVRIYRQLTSGGIIPARAGSTQLCRLLLVLLADHPRSRGEHLRRRLTHAGADGSSPLARGARGCDTSSPSAPGIIPARAGSTFATKVWLGSHEDHPRSRGEHPMRDPGGIASIGSSPLARGARREGDG